ncbi:hypothetical protein BES34_004845 [Leptospira inadai serovar Lyme]|uniref:Uncharacterized protein n=1 Tax=Leptospira inadai serovar Lyme TaxID=293084 RepID=A0ABX4YM21_9LEPT|nr:hypothetical protein BES34_004845 [Leptospira inadai serovar Lyme]
MGLRKGLSRTARSIQLKFVNLSRFRTAKIVFFLLIFCFTFPSPAQEETLPNFTEQDPLPQRATKEKPRIFRHNRLTYQEKPYKAPSSIPSDFVPRESKLLFSTELKSERIFETRESAIILNHSLSKERLEIYYETVFSYLNFKVLQNQKSPEKSVYLVEGMNRKTVAVSISPDGTGSLVKLFYRKSGGF